MRQDAKRNDKARPVYLTLRRPRCRAAIRSASEPTKPWTTATIP